MKQSLGKDLAARLKLYSERMRAEGKKPGWEDLAAEIDAWIIDKKLLKKPLKRAEANAVIEALAESLGLDIEKVPTVRWARIGKCLKGIREIQPDVTAEMVKQAVLTYKRIHPQWDCTENSIERYWDQLVPKARPTQAGENETPPYGWEQALREMGDANNVSPDTIGHMIATGWQKLSIGHRTSIKGHLAKNQLPQLRNRAGDE